MPETFSDEMISCAAIAVVNDFISTVNHNHLKHLNSCSLNLIR